VRLLPGIGAQRVVVRLSARRDHDKRRRRQRGARPAPEQGNPRRADDVDGERLRDQRLDEPAGAEQGPLLPSLRGRADPLPPGRRSRSPPAGGAAAGRSARGGWTWG
jgi:hypothetical protein